MIKLEGTIINVFTQQGGKDKKTGEAFADRDKIQLLGEFELPNGDKKNELIDLTVENGKEYEGTKNKRVSIPCGALASGRNVIFTLQKVQHQNFYTKYDTR